MDIGIFICHSLNNISKKENDMALTGMDIFKMLPKTNCRECGLPTCIAFAMSLASRKIELSACPYVSEEVKAALAAVDAPPIKTIEIGSSDKGVKIGGETVLLRHEKKFNHPTALALMLPDTMAEEEAEARLLRFNKLRYCRMGVTMGCDLLAVKNDSCRAEPFMAMIEKAVTLCDAGLILMCTDHGIMSEALERFKDKKPLIHAATPENADQMAQLALDFACPLAARAENLDALSALSERLGQAGVESIVLDPCNTTPQDALYNQVHIRRAAVRKNVKPFGYPTMAFACDLAANLDVETVLAAMLIAKYAGIVVLSDLQGETLFPLLLQRSALFSDPQTPPMVPGGVYEIGSPQSDSPVLLASSWALTYYSLSLGAEAAQVPVFLCFEEIREPDVMCWCRHCLQSNHKGEFDAAATARFVRSCKLEERVTHRKLVICERNTPLKLALEKALPEWEIVIGPDRADRLYTFLPDYAKKLAKECKTA